MPKDKFFTFPFLFFLVVFVGTIGVVAMMSKIGVGPGSALIRRLSPEQLLINGYSEAVQTATQPVREAPTAAALAAPATDSRAASLKETEAALLKLAPPEPFRFAHLKLVRLSALWREALEQNKENDAARFEEEWEDLVFMIVSVRL